MCAKNGGYAMLKCAICASKQVFTSGVCDVEDYNLCLLITKT